MFDPPVPIYVDNFIALPVGTNVPSGYYDREKGQWVAGANGRVIKVLSITAGKANLDVDGSGTDATAATLSAMGISDAERTQLATLYPVDMVFWRVPVGHFSLWDFNLGFLPPAGSAPGSPGDDASDSPGQCKTAAHSTIECESQTLTEQVAVSSTTTYTYDVLGNLINVTLPGSVSLDYVADANGRRVGKKRNGALVQGLIYSDQLRIAAELKATTTFSYGTKANVPDFMHQEGVT